MLGGIAVAAPIVALGAGLVPFGSFLPTAAAADGETDDMQFTSFVIGLELALVTLYNQAVKSGKLSSAASKTASDFSSHHSDHSQVMGTLASAGGGTVPTAGNATLLSQFAPQIATAADEPAILAVLGQLEEAMAATYFQALGTLQSTALSAAVAATLPVEAQHAVVLSAAGATPPQPTEQAVPATQTNAGQLTPAALPQSNASAPGATTTPGATK